MKTNETFANANKINVESVVNALSFDTPQNVAKNLLSIYFTLSEYIMADNMQDYSNCDDIQEGLYTLKSLYWALSDTSNQKTL